MSLKRILIVVLALFLIVVTISNSNQENAAGIQLTPAMETAVSLMTRDASINPTTTYTIQIPPTLLTPPPGPVNSPTPEVNAVGNTSYLSACDQAGFIHDVTVPDGTMMAPGVAFKKTWRLRNDGSCNWTPGYQLVFHSGDPMSGPLVNQLTPIEVSPGAAILVSIDLVAPMVEGRYTGFWYLRNGSGEYFGIDPLGSPFYVEIIVVQGGQIPKPTSATTKPPRGDPTTPSPTKGEESAPTNTAVPTESSLPYPEP